MGSNPTGGTGGAGGRAVASALVSEQEVPTTAVGGWPPASWVFRRPMTPFTWAGVSRRALAVLSALVVLRAAAYAVLGAQLVLDDYSILAAIRADGMGEGVPALQWGRPVGWLTDTLVYGLVGAHPLGLLAVVTAVNLAAALLLYLVMGRFVRSRTAFFVAAVWVLAANHNTLTVWTATAPTVVAVVLVLAGILLLTDGRWIGAAVCLGLAVLAYELSFPVAFVAALLVPSARALDWRRRVVPLAAVALATGWVALDPLNSPSWDPPGVPLVWRALFSSGLVGTADAPDRLVHYLGDLVAVGLVACLVAWLAGQRDREDGPALALTGVVVILLGAVGFVNLGLGTEGIGMQDRLLAVSSVGAALVLVGVLQFAHRHLRVAAAVAAVVLVGVLVAGQFVSLRSWARAGEDAVAINRFVAAVADPSADNPVDVTVGSERREHNGVIGISEPSGSAAASYRLRFGDDAGRLRLVTSEREFVSANPDELLLDWTWIDNGVVFDDGVGFVAAVTVPAPGQATFYGWAEDGGPGSEPVEVEFLVDGEVVGRAVADHERADIAQALGRPDPAHAFEQAVEVPGGTHTVCARTVGHGDVSLGCQEVEVLPGGQPVGVLESATVVAPGTVEVRGWAADVSAGRDPIDVEVTVGPVTQTVTADQARPDIEGATGFDGGPDHGFVAQVPVGAGDFTACAVARNVGEGDDLPLGNCLAVSVP